MRPNSLAKAVAWLARRVCREWFGAVYTFLFIEVLIPRFHALLSQGETALFATLRFDHRFFYSGRAFAVAVGCK